MLGPPRTSPSRSRSRGKARQSGSEGNFSNGRGRSSPPNRTRGNSRGGKSRGIGFNQDYHAQGGFQSDNFLYHLSQLVSNAVRQETQTMARSILGIIAILPPEITALGL